MPTRSATDLPEPGQLNLRHRVFADHYLLHGNASEAARDAGYARRNAPKQGCELLKREDVQAYIADQRAELIAAFGLSREEVVRDLRAVAHSTLEHYDLTDDGKLAPRPGAPRDAIRAVRSFKNTEHRSEKVGSDGRRTLVITKETEIAFWPKIEALRMEAEILALVGRNALPLIERIDTAADDQPATGRTETKKLHVQVRVVRE